jgi:hypothetical protein
VYFVRLVVLTVKMRPTVTKVVGVFVRFSCAASAYHL